MLPQPWLGFNPWPRERPYAMGVAVQRKKTSRMQRGACAIRGDASKGNLSLVPGLGVEGLLLCCVSVTL